MTEISDLQLVKNKILLRPDEAARVLRISLRQIYYLCELRVLEPVHIRKSLRIKTESLVALLENEP
jgi:hypothetical protein